MHQTKEDVDDGMAARESLLTTALQRELTEQETEQFLKWMPVYNLSKPETDALMRNNPTVALRVGQRLAAQQTIHQPVFALLGTSATVTYRHDTEDELDEKQLQVISDTQRVYEATRNGWKKQYPTLAEQPVQPLDVRELIRNAESNTAPDGLSSIADLNEVSRLRTENGLGVGSTSSSRYMHTTPSMPVSSDRDRISNGIHPTATAAKSHAAAPVGSILPRSRRTRILSKLLHGKVPDTPEKKELTDTVLHKFVKFSEKMLVYFDTHRHDEASKIEMLNCLQQAQIFAVKAALIPLVEDSVKQDEEQESQQILQTLLTNGKSRLLQSGIPSSILPRPAAATEATEAAAATATSVPSTLPSEPMDTDKRHQRTDIRRVKGVVVMNSNAPLTRKTDEFSELMRRLGLKTALPAGPAASTSSASSSSLSDSTPASEPTTTEAAATATSEETETGQSQDAVVAQDDNDDHGDGDGDKSIASAETTEEAHGTRETSGKRKRADAAVAADDGDNDDHDNGTTGTHASATSTSSTHTDTGASKAAQRKKPKQKQTVAPTKRRQSKRLRQNGVS